MPGRDTIGFVGAGKMGAALMRGLISSGIAPAGRLLAWDVLPEALERLQQQTGVEPACSNRELCARCDVIVLAVYPAVVPQVLAEIRDQIRERHLLVSLAAGVSCQSILEQLGTQHRVIRVMPNTPALLGEGAAAYCLAGSADSEDESFIVKLLAAVGRACKVDEIHMDAVTGLSGSGPAYVFTLIEAMSDGAVRMGLPRSVATLLAAQTVLGAATMVRDTGLHPGQLKDQVTSAGGTTIAGIHALERGGFRGAVMDAVQAATLRSRELSQR